MPRPRGIALIGPGNFGRRLLKALRSDPRIIVTGLLGSSAAESAAAAAETGLPSYDSLADLLSGGNVDGVVVATPTFTHSDIVVACAAAGKQIFCEKPLALTAGECDRMITACREAGVALFAGHVQRLFPAVRETIRLVRAGAVGTPVTIDTARHDLLLRSQGSWLRSREKVGGLLHQSTVHEFDWLRAAFGDIATIHALSGNRTIQGGLDFPDSAALALSFRGGPVASLSACMTSWIRRHGATILGDAGGIAFDLVAGTLSLGSPDGTVTVRSRDDYRFEEGHALAIAAEMAAFVDTVVGDAEPLIPGEEGAQAVEAAQAAVISMARNDIITLPLTDEDRRALPPCQF